MRIKFGFTQTELVTVAAILGALATISVPRIVTSSNEAKAVACKSNMIIINKIIDSRLARTNIEPRLEEVIADRTVFPDGPPECPFGQPYIIGQYGHITSHNH